MIVIDGTIGEGGGQILRSALSLSLLTGQPFTLNHIRAGRSKPGLRPQHLAAVQAAAQISHATVEGDRQGSGNIVFIPGHIKPGDYHFDIGTAGATSLVLQTLLPPLAISSAMSQVTITGGTHVPWSPCFHYVAWHWAYYLSRMGMRCDLTLTKAGFYPEGGGEVQASIPGNARIEGIHVENRGKLLRVRGLSGIANLPMAIAERQRNQALTRLHDLLPKAHVEVDIEAFPAQSKGTVLLLLVEFENSQACFFSLGALGKPAERVANEAVNDLAKFLSSDGAVDPWIADQLLLPLAMASGSSLLRTSEVTQHLLTNAQVIRYFLPTHITVDAPLGQPASIRLEGNG
jgi:RNA 3'-terminal phosphate cyclase (ATP)